MDGSSGSIYDTLFLTKSGETLCLRVEVPFANVSNGSRDVCPVPIMTLVGVKAEHPWLEQGSMRVSGRSFTPLKDDDSWSQTDLKLGEIVCSVVEHLQLNPPNIIMFTDPDLAAQNNTVVGGYSDGDPPAYPGPGPDRRHPGRPFSDEYWDPIPVAPEYFPELESMNREEMRKLLDDSVAFNEFLKGTSYMVPLNKSLSLQKENVTNAEELLKVKDDLLLLFSDIIEMKGQLREKLEAFEPLEKKYARISMPPSKKAVLQKLNAARREMNTLTEEVTKRFVDGNMNVDDYIEEFMAERSLYHERAAKMERLQRAG